MKRWSNSIKDNQGPDLLPVGGMISDELLSRTKPVWAKDCRLGRSWVFEVSKGEVPMLSAQLQNWLVGTTIKWLSIRDIQFASDNNTPSRAWGTFEIRGLFFFRLTRELVIHARFDIWYLCWFMFRHGTRAPNHGPSTTIPDSAKAISMLADSGSVLEVPAVFYHNKFVIQCLNKLKNQPNLSSISTNLSQTKHILPEATIYRPSHLPTVPTDRNVLPEAHPGQRNGKRTEAFRERLEGYGSPDWLWEVQLHGRFLKEPAGNMWLRRDCWVWRRFG